MNARERANLERMRGLLLVSVYILLVISNTNAQENPAVEEKVFFDQFSTHFSRAASF